VHIAYKIALCKPIDLNSVKNEWAKKAVVCGIFFLFDQMKNKNHGKMRLCKGATRDKTAVWEKKETVCCATKCSNLKVAIPLVCVISLGKGLFKMKEEDITQIE
jgi:hypothetical protein